MLHQSTVVKEVLGVVMQCPEFWKSGIFSDMIKKTVVVEYSSPNIAKPFHVGHLRSTIIGNFIASLHEALGHKVIRLNYLGDWGTQFGLLQVGLDMTDYTEEQIKENPIQCLYKIYVQANAAAEKDPEVAAAAREVFKRLEEGSLDDRGKWNTFRDYTIKELETVYRRLGVHFTEYHWESMYAAKDIQGIVDKLRNQNILKTTDTGKSVVELSPKKIVTLIKSDGSTLYLTRDIAAAIDRYEKYNFDNIYYVVDNSQTDHFAALFQILSSMGYDWAQNMKHIKFGLIRGMSTRKGTVVFLKDVLDEAQEIMLQKQKKSPNTRINENETEEEIADIVGVTAVLVNDMKQRRKRDYVFDWDKVLQSQGDTGIKMQYTHCRLCSLKKNCGIELSNKFDASALTEPEAVSIIKEIARFEEVLQSCYEELEPYILVIYLFRLCNAVSVGLKTLPVKGQEPSIAAARLMLFCAAKIILKHGMIILGLQPLEEM